MTAASTVAAFRQQAALAKGNESWVTIGQQSAVWKRLLTRVTSSVVCKLNPIICVDLDLTSLLAPQKSRDVLDSLRPFVHGFAAVAGVPAGTLDETLDRIWRNACPALLPGYTSTSIQAYGIYCTAQLQVLSGQPVAADRLDGCEKWIADQVHARLRSGYWDRDLAADQPAAGFSDWACRIREAGGRIVFLTNRDPAAREASLECIRYMLGDAGAPFVFFGPGGSAFDASSKAAAIALIEQGVCSGIHYGSAENGQTKYVAPAPGLPFQTVVAVIDDRTENRRQIIEASAGSEERLESNGIGTVMDIASAAEGFCPEMDVVDMSEVISSFVFTEDA